MSLALAVSVELIGWEEFASKIIQQYRRKPRQEANMTKIKQETSVSMRNFLAN